MGPACTKDAGVVVRTKTTPAPGKFEPFSQLNDDVILCILSYVSFAPFEYDRSSTITLAAVDLRELKVSDEEAWRLLEDYKMVQKKQSSLPPFRPLQQYYQAAFRASSCSGNHSHSRVSSLKSFGTLTHVLPLVNKKFYVLCNTSNVLWTESLERLLGAKKTWPQSSNNSSDLWKKGVISFIKSSGVAVAGSTIGNERESRPSDEAMHLECESVRKLVEKAVDCCSILKPLQIQIATDGSLGDSVAQKTAHSFLEKCVAQEVFRQVLLYRKPVRLPVFTLPCSTTLGEELYFRLHEPRYRLLIADVMAGRPSSQRKGLLLSSPRPRFLFACKPDPLRSKVACIVEVRKCLIHLDGVADIVIVPISWVLMQDVAERPQSGGLLDATVVPSPKRSSMPVFCSLLTPLRLGHPIRLYFLEQRYKILIAEVMAGRPDSERNDSFVAMPRPQFIYACHSPLKTGIIAAVVEVERCCLRSDGSARLTVVPCSWVVIETLTSRPNSGWLFDATVLHPMP